VGGVSPDVFVMGGASIKRPHRWPEHSQGLKLGFGSGRVAFYDRRLLASGCSPGPAWWRMPNMPAVPLVASAHAGAGRPARCRRSTLLEAMGHQQLLAGSWVEHCLGTAHRVPGPAAPQV
jgi:hypothetical protein